MNELNSRPAGLAPGCVAGLRVGNASPRSRVRGPSGGVPAPRVSAVAPDALDIASRSGAVGSVVSASSARVAVLTGGRYRSGACAQPGAPVGPRRAVAVALMAAGLAVCGLGASAAAAGDTPVPLSVPGIAATAVLSWVPSATGAVEPGSSPAEDPRAAADRVELAQATPGAPATEPPASSRREPWLPTPALPRQDLTRQVLFQYMLAEIAAQRGRYDVAVAGMTGLARATRDPRIAQRATELSVRAGALKAAIEAAELWVAVDERSVQARQALVALYLNAGQIDLARPHLQSLLAAEGENIGSGFLQLNTLFAKHGDRARVLAVVRELAAAHPQLREARFAVAQAAWNAGQYDLSLAQAREALRLSPDWELAALFEAQVLARRSPAEAIVALEAFVRSNPRAAEARLNLARLYASEKRLPEARALFRAIAGESPDNLDASFAAGLLALQSGDHEEASTLLARVLSGDTRDPDLVRYYLARAEDARGRLPQALEHYRGVAAGEHRLSAQIGAASVLGRMGRVPEARESLGRVVPESLAERVQLTLAEVQILRDARDFKSAYDVLGTALARTPDSPELLYEQALIAERLGRFEVLERNLRRVIQIQPDHAHAYNALGYSFADRNLRLNEALALIETALRLAPEDPYILDSMGWVLFRMGQTDKALEFLRRAWRGKPDAEIGAHLGEVLWVLGARDEARRIWDEAIKVEAGNETLRSTMKRLLRR